MVAASGRSIQFTVARIWWRRDFGTATIAPHQRPPRGLRTPRRLSDCSLAGKARPFADGIGTGVNDTTPLADGIGTGVNACAVPSESTNKDAASVDLISMVMTLSL